MRVRFRIFLGIAAILTASAVLLQYPDRVIQTWGSAGILAATFSAAWALRSDSIRGGAVESLRQLNTALDHANEAIARLDVRGVYISVNAAYARCCGYEPGEMLGRHWTLTVHPQDRQKMCKAFDYMLQSGLAKVDALACRKDGSAFHTHVVMVALHDDNGKLVGHHRFMKDITLRKLSEAALNASERRFRVLASHAPVGIFQCDIEGCCSYVNARWIDITGVGARQAEKTGWLRALHPDDRSHALATWPRAAAEKEWNADLRFCRADGNTIRVSCSTAPIHDDMGSVTGYIGIVTDITAIKESEEILVRQAEELRRSNRELEQFAYIASHDLQEPLRMVSNYTQLLERRYRGKLGPEADEFINYAVEGAKRMRSLIDDVLDFARVSRDAPRQEPTDLGPLLSAALADLAAVIREKNAVITSDPLPVVIGNGSQLRQVLQNLLGNAIKFCNRPPRVHLEARRQDNGWIISVRDNGIGIEPEHLDKIFQVFQRLHSNSEFAGNGIGLAVCKRIIERHKGTIQVASRLNEGSTFTFTVPAANIDQPAEERLCA
jgi:PAS domain S-box-containing protein